MQRSSVHTTFLEGDFNCINYICFVQQPGRPALRREEGEPDGGTAPIHIMNRVCDIDLKIVKDLQAIIMKRQMMYIKIINRLSTPVNVAWKEDYSTIIVNPKGHGSLFQHNSNELIKPDHCSPAYP